MILSTINFEEACKDIAIDFMKLKLGEDFDIWYAFGDGWEYFIGDDFEVFSDGSDYYHWNISEMYTIVDKQIPYDIATEHQDWTIENEEKPQWWVKLEYYYARRRWYNLPAKDFQRMLEREYHLDRADRLTDEYERVTNEQIEEIKRKFEQELRESIK